jgi:hypothetical protein
MKRDRLAVFETSHTLGRALPLATQDGLIFRPSSIIIAHPFNEEIFPNRRRRVAVLNVTRAQGICHGAARVRDSSSSLCDDVVLRSCRRRVAAAARLARHVAIFMPNLFGIISQTFSRAALSYTLSTDCIGEELQGGVYEEAFQPYVVSCVCAGTRRCGFCPHALY